MGGAGIDLFIQLWEPFLLVPEWAFSLGETCKRKMSGMDYSSLCCSWPWGHNWSSLIPALLCILHPLNQHLCESQGLRWWVTQILLAERSDSLVTGALRRPGLLQLLITIKTGQDITRRYPGTSLKCQMYSSLPTLCNSNPTFSW